jgi:RND family efflux transporter MFP subunit
MILNVKQRFFVLGAVLVCAYGGTLAMRRVHASVPREQIAAPRAAVAVVKRQTVSSTTTMAGEFLPMQEVELHAKVTGYIRKINVDIGDRVRTGQVIAVLEVPELNAQVAGADAGVRHSQDEIQRAQHELSRAKAAHDALHAAALRLQQASKARPGLIAQQELDDANAKDLASEAQVEGARSALSAAQQQLDMSKATHSQVSAMQDYSRIIAPFDGVVTWRYADTGALVQAGTSSSSGVPVVKLAQVNTLRLRIPVPEQIKPYVHVGSVADVRVQATGEEFTGKVARLTDSLDRSTRTMQVEIEVPNDDHHLAPGMYANVRLEVQNHPNALTVPVRALSGSAEKPTVLLLDPQNRIQVREIRTGIAGTNRVEVLAGLQEGDRVVVGNPGAYHPGESVDPITSSISETELSSNEGGGQ